jgi:glyoxylase I family protein
MAIAIDSMVPLIQVFDMPSSLRFYRDLLGFHVVSDSGNGDESSWAWLRLNDCDLLLNDQYEPGCVPPEPPVERTRWHEDTCLYFGAANLDEAYEYLRSKGVSVRPPSVASYGMRQLCFQDPDNYQICLQQPFGGETQ